MMACDALSIFLKLQQERDVAVKGGHSLVGYVWQGEGQWV